VQRVKLKLAKTLILHIKESGAQRNWCSAAINLDRTRSEADISHAAMQQTN
jgi:hypothetical protein